MESWKAKIYKSPRWVAVRNHVVNRDRNVCGKCNRLIVGRADVHHIIELTKENHQDDSIAFNPNNLITLHQDCHNRIHGRFIKESIVQDNLEIDYERR